MATLNRIQSNPEESIGRLWLNIETLPIGPLLLYHQSESGEVHEGIFYGCGQRCVFLWMAGVILPLNVSAWIT